MGWVLELPCTAACPSLLPGHDAAVCGNAKGAARLLTRLRVVEDAVHTLPVARAAQLCKVGAWSTEDNAHLREGEEQEGSW